MYLDCLGCSDRDVAKVDRSGTIQWDRHWRAHTDDFRHACNIESAISECWALELIQSARRRDIDPNQFARIIRYGFVGFETSIHVSYPDDTCSRLAFVGGNSWNTDADTSSGVFWTLSDLAEQRGTFLIETKLVNQQRFANGCEIDVAAFERVGAGTTEDRIWRDDGLDNIICSTRSKFETTQVVRIHDVGFSVLANRYRDSSDTVSALEDTRIKQRNAARSQIPISGVHTNVFIRLKVVLKCNLAVTDGEICYDFVEC